LEFYYASGLDQLIFEEIRLYPFHLISTGRYFSSKVGRKRSAGLWPCDACFRQQGQHHQAQRAAA